MSDYETGSLVIQSVGIVGLVCTVIVYYLQLRAMQGQLRTAGDASKAQNILSVTAFLQSTEVRNARRVVQAALSQKPDPATWNDDESREASTVCASYDLAAILIRLKLVEPSVVIDHWGPSIRRCYSILRPFIQERQQSNRMGASYWNDFAWLNSEAEEFHNPR